MRLFVDASVVVDFLNDCQGLNRPARKLMILGFLHEHELWLSAAQATDLFYVLASGGQAAEADDAKKTLRHLRRALRICSLNEADVDAALESTWDDFESACVHQCALKLKVDAIVTRNKKDFKKSSIKVFDCEELFAYFAEEKGLVYEEIPW